MSLGFIAGSNGNVVANDYNNNSHNSSNGVNSNLTPGDGTNFGAKDRGFYSSYESEW